MHLTYLDWSIVGVYLLISFGIGIYFSKTAGKNLGEFFAGGRGLTWWMAGLSMVATTFAADTPLAVTELVRRNGISGNWLWWNMLLGGMLTVFFFAKYWHRAGVLTDVELIAIRYFGKGAYYLRLFKSLYMGLLMNGIIIGWVNLAMVSVLEVFFGLSRGDALFYTFFLMLLTGVYASLGGLRGVVVTDVFQFSLAMFGCIVLAVMVLLSDKIGGLTNLVERLPSSFLQFTPSVGAENKGGSLALNWGTFIAFVGVQWWASWYPGAEPGGGGYIAQRIFATKSERQGVFAILFFQIAHYAIRPLPWVIVALCTLIIYPNLAPADDRLSFLFVIRDFMPSGLRGLMLVAFLAAYMSTLATQLNWGASYIVNDFYKVLKTKESDNHYVWIGRSATIIMMLLSFAITLRLESISQAWEFILECGAGLGLVLILRWYWWRVSAWSEIIATICPFVCYGIFKYCFYSLDNANTDSFFQFPNTYFLTVGITTIVWITATYFLPQTDKKILQQFYEKVKPNGYWQIITQQKGWHGEGLIGLLICWLLSVLGVYCILFGMGKILFGEILLGIGLILGAAGCVIGVSFFGKKYL